MMSLVVSSVDASYELAFVRNFACLRARNDVLMNLNASAGVNACSSALGTNEMTLARSTHANGENETSPVGGDSLKKSP